MRHAHAQAINEVTTEPRLTKVWVIAKQWWAVKRNGVVIAFVGVNQPKKQGKEIADGLIATEKKRAKGKSS